MRVSCVKFMQFWFFFFLIIDRICMNDFGLPWSWLHGPLAEPLPPPLWWEASQVPRLQLPCTWSPESQVHCTSSIWKELNNSELQELLMHLCNSSRAVTELLALGAACTLNLSQVYAKFQNWSRFLVLLSRFPRSKTTYRRSLRCLFYVDYMALLSRTNNLMLFFFQYLLNTGAFA